MLGSLFVLPNGISGPAPATAAPPAFSITTNPPLDPSFNPAILNYAVRCTGSPTTNVTTTGSGQVTVGGTSLPNPVDVNLPLVAGQGLQITNGATSYFIRCLPSDFPTYSAAVTGQPQQANGYFLTLAPYSVVFDTDGVPVWWYRDGDAFSPFDAKFINPSTIAYSDGFLGTYSLRGLDGTLKLTLGGGSNPLDFHDLQQLPNGNYLGIMDVTRNCPADPTQCVDLSSWGLSSQSTISDDVIVELNPANQIVWQWSVADHINVATANVNWHDLFPDVVHMNSILYDGNGGIIFSARHFDAVYRIDMATGAITWKLGGSTTPQSLNVVGDQNAQLFSGQHFPRLQPDGSLTVHDNGTRANRQPRALRFTIDTSTNTATEVEQVTDPRTTPSPCCGSATKLTGGDWVISWGGLDYMTELNSQGVPQMTITYPGTFSYRVADVPVSVDALRQGMDAMVPPLTDVPATSVVIPSNGATLSGSTLLDAFASNATSVQFQLFGGVYGFWGPILCTAGPTYFGYLCNWNTANVPNGSYVLSSEATNSAGTTLSSGVNITVNNAPPPPSVLIPTNGATLSGSTLLDASATNATTVQFQLFGGVYGFWGPILCTAGPTWFGYLCNWNTANVPNGSYVLSAEASNSAGITLSSGVNITVNN